MPVRYTCRVLVVRTESGKLRVRYGHLSEESVRFLTIHGPQMFMPPDREMTEEEFARWEFETVCGTGFTYSYSNSTSLDAPLVEAKRTYEDTIPKGVVQTELAWAENGQGDRVLAVKVRNGWDQAIPKFSLTTECHYDAPQPQQMGQTQALMLGGSESMFLPIGFSCPDLYPTMTAGYALDAMVMPMLRSRVASLSTESYYIALRTDGYEFERIPGHVVGEFLDSGEQVTEG
jgi:hypothetical protein